MTSQKQKSVSKANSGNHHSSNQINSKSFGKLSSKDKIEMKINKAEGAGNNNNGKNQAESDEDRLAVSANGVGGKSIEEHVKFNNVKIEIDEDHEGIRGTGKIAPPTSKAASEAEESSYDAIPNDIDYHCDYCKAPLPIGKIRIHCIECTDYDLCVDCFCKGNVNNGHLLTHKYTPIGPNKFSLFNDKWSADEEIVLLEGISKYGFGNWKQISEMIASTVGSGSSNKTPEECESHYKEVYLSSKFAPFPDLAKVENLEVSRDKRGNKLTLSKDVKDEITRYIDDSNSSDHDFRKEVSDRAVSHPEYIPEYWEPNLVSLSESIANSSSSNIQTTFQAIQPFRRELEDEFDNDAEILVRDLEFDPADTPSEIQLKLRLVDLYNSRLDERIYRKLNVFHKAFPLDSYPTGAPTLQAFKGNWYDAIRLNSRSFSDDHEAKISADLVPFFRFLSKDEYLRMIKLMVVREEVLKRIEMLKEWSKLGLYNINEIKEFEQRNIEFGTANKSNRRYFKKSTQSGVILNNESITLDLNPVFRTDFKLSDKQFKDLFDTVSSLPEPEPVFENEEFSLEPVCNATIHMTKESRGGDTNCFIATSRTADPEHFQIIAPFIKNLPIRPSQYIIFNQTDGFNEEHVTGVSNKFANEKIEQLKSINGNVFDGLPSDPKQDSDISLLRSDKYRNLRIVLYCLNDSDIVNESSASAAAKRKKLLKNLGITNEFFRHVQSKIKIKNDFPSIYYKPERASWVVETSDLPGPHGKLRKILFPIHKLGFEYAYFCAVQRRVKTLWDCFVANDPNPQVDDSVLSVFEHYSAWCKAIRATKFNVPTCTIMNSKLSSQIILFLTKRDLN